MHVLILSQCQKAALARSRAVLDSFALRVGERTWASPMTVEGLQELRSALRRNASRHTAVACYQNDGRRRMKLLWTVGARGMFGPNGHYPSGTTATHGGQAPPPDWVRVACWTVRAAGLAHDFGKASQYFQELLRGTGPIQRQHVRHEWVSLKVLQALRANGFQWESAWRAVREAPNVAAVTFGKRTISQRDMGGPQSALETIDALVVMHHGLLSCPPNSGDAPLATAHPEKNRLVRVSRPAPSYFTPQGKVSAPLLASYRSLEGKGSTAPDGHPDFWHALSVYARAALVFADHVVSAERTGDVEPTSAHPDDLFANTTVSARQRWLNQPLSWHLQHVSDRAGGILWRMAAATVSGMSPLPGDSLEGLSDETVDRLRAPAGAQGRFAWQNRAAAMLEAGRQAHPDAPALVFNMAGTGAGKTRLNLRAVCALSRDRRPRVAIALNLRSLTLQTGRALQTSIGIGGDEIATIIGDDVTRRLAEAARYASTNATPEEELREVVVDEVADDTNAPIACLGDAQDLPGWLAPLFREDRERAVLATPLLVSTIDFLGAASTPGAQAHYVKAVCRLMTSDLVLDEIDSYEPEALVAVLRLVQLSALFGRTVLCASATLSVPVALAVDRAFRAGIALRSRLTACCLVPAAPTVAAAVPPQATDSFPPLVPESPKAHYLRAIVDDSTLLPQIEPVSLNSLESLFDATFKARVAQLVTAAAQAPVVRLAGIGRLGVVDEATWFETVTASVRALHQSHAWPVADTGRSVSFGLVRVANIGTAVAVARHLAKALPEARVACYHSGLLRMQRFAIEQRLDALLSRAHGDGHLHADPEICAILRESKTPSVPFVVVATPVEEIGRDHDFDWAVLEPSSAQSLVQAAGRVNRHRQILCSAPNITILQYNRRHCRMSTQIPLRAAFLWPGYEARSASDPARSDYADHDLARLLRWDPVTDLLPVTAALRLDPTVPFAAADDAAILLRLKKFVGPAGCFVASPASVWLLTERPYLLTPLRAESCTPSEWRLAMNGDQWTVERRVEMVVTSRGHSVPCTRWVTAKMSKVDPGADIVITEAERNAWLALTPNELSDRCYELDIDPQDGLSVSLQAYGDLNPRFEYDLGFGFVLLRR